ncbi:hypothetical protein [Fluviicola taffensis]|uniref:hypothetical protein n=1 Tax=Fluviicola taffensis TaxID=191579 RepID=UPI0031383484
MKTKTPIKILTLTLFVALISGFTLYQGGYLFSNENKVKYILDPNGGTASELKSVSREKYGLSTFQKLKLSGGFDPKNFDTMYIEPPGNDRFISSSKSMIIKFKAPQTDLVSSFLKTQLKHQLKKK